MNCSSVTAQSSWNSLPYDIAETLLQSCLDFSSMRALALTARIFNDVLKNSPNATYTAIARRRFRCRAFDVLNMWRPCGLSDFAREALASYTTQRPRLGQEDSALSPDINHFGKAEILRLVADENDVYFLGAYFLSVYVDAAEIGSFGRRYLSRNGYPTPHHPRLDLIRNIARHPDRPINGKAYFDLFREDMVFFDQERGIMKARSFQEILGGYYAAISMARGFLPFESLGLDPEKLPDGLPRRGVYDHNIHTDFTERELVGLHYIGGHDVEGNLIDITAMRTDFAPSFGSYILTWTTQNREKYAKFLQEKPHWSDEPDYQNRLVEQELLKDPNCSGGELKPHRKALIRCVGVDLKSPTTAFSISYRDFHSVDS